MHANSVALNRKFVSKCVILNYLEGDVDLAFDADSWSPDVLFNVDDLVKAHVRILHHIRLLSSHLSLSWRGREVYTNPAHDVVQVGIEIVLEGMQVDTEIRQAWRHFL